MRAQGQGAKQPVGFHQPLAQNFCQFAARDAAGHFHLKQAVLRMHKTQGAVEVGFVFGGDVRHPAFVVMHRHGGFQLVQGQAAVAFGEFGVEVPAAHDQGHDQRAPQQGEQNDQAQTEV